LLFIQANLLLLASFCTAFVICVAIVLTQKLHGRWTRDSEHGIQKIHTHPTPRIGGIGVFVGMLVAYFFILQQLVPQAGGALKILQTLLLGGGICFAAGFFEDITKRISVSMRLIACVVAAIVAVSFSSAYIGKVGLPWIDALLGWMPHWATPFAPIAVIFTCFAVAGLANAFNIVDGFNGLSSGIAMVVCLGIAAIAAKAGDLALAQVALCLIAAILGFWLLNWPYGKLFLGDGGAYFIGFCVAWLVILLPARNASVNPWASLLLVAYPVAEVFFSVIRRIKRTGHHPGAPDKVHMHHLVYARWIRKHFSRTATKTKSDLANGMTALVISMINAAIVVFTYWIHHSQVILTVAFALVICVFSLVYSRLASFK
jgi:UDP-N-acetylmuramyl pentapeptide phosphotransferase/UDP-N-acetylglucosamine-1-phosphate transferase